MSEESFYAAGEELHRETLNWRLGAGRPYKELMQDIEKYLPVFTTADARAAFFLTVPAALFEAGRDIEAERVLADVHALTAVSGRADSGLRKVDLAALSAATVRQVQRIRTSPMGFGRCELEVTCPACDRGSNAWDSAEWRAALRQLCFVQRVRVQVTHAPLMCVCRNVRTPKAAFAIVNAVRDDTGEPATASAVERACRELGDNVWLMKHEARRVLVDAHCALADLQWPALVAREVAGWMLPACTAEAGDYFVNRVPELVVQKRAKLFT